MKEKAQNGGSIMYFKLNVHEKNGKKLFISDTTEISAEKLQYCDYVKRIFKDKIAKQNGGRAIESVSFSLGFPKSVRDRITANGESITSDEAYAIVLGEKTKIYAKSERAFIYATSTINQLSDHGELCEGFIYDAPIGTIRGYRVYLPSREGLGDFLDMLDFLAYYKYNSIILEIGGAMEYKRHPEINEKWAEFCREVHSYSGRAKEIQQQTYPWQKNSIHCDNAEGDILTQDECRMLAAECRKRGLEPIPECPTYSHCDYIVMAHPEIRERENDGYPDTYCSKHPDSYKYVFDILEEVIEVFRPAKLNIGHDEMYSIGICRRCKGTPAHVLYANDVIKINDFLKERGIQTIMWGEKLLKSYTNEGEPVGGMGHGKGTWKVPALYPCRDLLPRDIIYLHWYWPFNYKYDRVFHDRGMKVIYGNLNALAVKKWNLRREWGINGGFVSNWGSFREEYMQRNMQYINLIGTAYAFWCSDFEERGEESVFESAAKEAYRLKCSRIKNPIKITHTTEHEIKYEIFYDGIFIVDEKYKLGEYEISYTDGSTYKLPVKYGTHVGSLDYQDPLHQGGFKQLTYGTLPKKLGRGYAYEAVYENPAPEKAICSVKYVPAPGKENIKVELLAFNAERSLDEKYEKNITLGEEKEFAMDGQ